MLATFGKKNNKMLRLLYKNWRESPEKTEVEKVWYCYKMIIRCETMTVYYDQPSCCTNGFGMASMPSDGHINTTDVPRHTTKPNCLVSSVSLNGSSGSVNQKQNECSKIS
jgi:hypothetical protein